MPVRVAASSVAPFGDIASRFTYHQLEPAVDASCVQVVPPSMLVTTPAPRMPWAWSRPWPVPATAVCATPGSITISASGTSAAREEAALPVRAHRVGVPASVDQPVFGNPPVLVAPLHLAKGDRFAGRIGAGKRLPGRPDRFIGIDGPAADRRRMLEREQAH